MQIFEEDAEIVQCLATFEHLSMVCKSRHYRRRGVAPTPLSLRTAGRLDSLRLSANDAVLLIPSCYNVISLLRHAHRAVLIFPTLSYGIFSSLFDDFFAGRDMTGSRIDRRG